MHYVKYPVTHNSTPSVIWYFRRIVVVIRELIGLDWRGNPICNRNINDKAFWVFVDTVQLTD